MDLLLRPLSLGGLRAVLSRRRGTAAPRRLRRPAGRVLVALATVSLLASCTSGPPAPDATPSSVPAPSPVPLPPPRPEPAQPLLAVDHWRALFDRQATAVDAEAERLSRSTDSVDFYTLSYSIDAQASMFAATGDVAYARQGLRYATNMIASARPSSSLPTSSFQDDFRGWVSAANRDEETPLYESYAWRYVTRLLRMVEPELAEVPADVRAQYRQVLAFTETHIVDKWLARGADEYVYRSRTHMAAHWASIALDVSRLTADPDRRARCLEVVQAIDEDLPNQPSSLRGQFRPHPGDETAYWWSDVWGETSLPGQDVSHGSGVIAYIVESRDLDGSWSAEDVARLSRTLTEFVIGPPERHPEYVDGSGQGNGWIADGWVKLGRYDPAVQALLESYPVQNDQFFAAMAENARILAGRTN